MILTVKKYKLNLQVNKYDFVRAIKDVPEDKVFVEMVMDPMELKSNPEQMASYMYEAGKMVGDTFCIELVWQSENGNLFD